MYFRIYVLLKILFTESSTVVGIDGKAALGVSDLEYVIIPKIEILKTLKLVRYHFSS